MSGSFRNGGYGFPGEVARSPVSATFDAAYDADEDMLKVRSMQKKWRDAFVGTTIDPTRWTISQSGVGITTDVSSGVLAVSMGTTAGDRLEMVSTETFTVPVRLLINFWMSQRIVDQGFFVELCSVDSKTLLPDGNSQFGWYFEGTTATQGRYYLGNGGNDARWISAPATITTTASTGFGVYEVEAFMDQVWWHTKIADNASARATSFLREQMLPDLNALYKVRVIFENRRRMPVMNATNNGSGLIRLNVPTHGLSTGNTVEVIGVRGVTAANGTWTITNIDANNIDLQASTFSGTFDNAGNPTGGAAHGTVARLATNPATNTVISIQAITVSDYAELTAEITAGRGSSAAGQGMAVTVANTPLPVAGPAAHDAAISGNPVRIAARAITANYTAVATGDTADLTATSVGALVVRPYAIPEAGWSYVSAVTGITTAADTAVQAAAGTGIRRYVTGVQIQNNSTTASEFQIKDGSTVIWRAVIPANMEPTQFEFTTPLRTTANTALNIQAVTPASVLIVNMQGYTAP